MDEEDVEVEPCVGSSGALANANAFSRNSARIRKCSSSSALSASVLRLRTSENRCLLFPLDVLLLSLSMLSCPDEAEADIEAALEAGLESSFPLTPPREEA